MSSYPSYATFPYEKHDQPFPSVYDSEDEHLIHPVHPQYRSSRLDNQIHSICIPILLIAFICFLAHIDAPSEPKSKQEYVWRDYRNQELVEQQNTIFKGPEREGYKIPDFTDALRDVGY